MDKKLSIDPLAAYTITPGQAPYITLSPSGYFTYTLPEVYRNDKWSIPITDLTAHQIYQRIKEGYTLGVCYECKGTGKSISSYMMIDSKGNVKSRYIKCFCCQGKEKVLYSIEFKELAEAVLNKQTNLGKERKEKDDSEL